MDKSRADIQKYLRLWNEHAESSETLRARAYALTSKLERTSQEMKRLKLNRMAELFFELYAEEITDITDELRALIYLISLDSKNR